MAAIKKDQELLRNHSAYLAIYAKTYFWLIIPSLLFSLSTPLLAEESIEHPNSVSFLSPIIKPPINNPRSSESIKGKVIELRKDPSFTLKPWAIDPEPLIFDCVLVGDFNGDGASDLASHIAKTGEWFVYRSSQTKNFERVLWAKTGPGNQWDFLSPKDMDQDGFDDILLHEKANNKWLILRSDGKSQFLLHLPEITNFPESLSNVSSGDLNGDRLPDLIGLDLSTNQLWSASADSKLNFIGKLIGGAPKAKNFSSFFVADVNADSFDDIIWRTSNSLRWRVSLSNGRSELGRLFKGRLRRKNISWLLNNEPANISETLPADLNGDGRMDLVLRDQAHEIFYALIANSTQAGYSSMMLEELFLGVDWENVLIGDFDGNGTDDVLVRGKDHRNWSLIVLSDPSGMLIPVSGTFPIERKWEKFGVGDFNADGLDDVYAYDTENGEWWIAESNISQGVLGVKIASKSLEAVEINLAVTDANGNFSVSPSDIIDHCIYPSHSEFSFVPKERCPNAGKLLFRAQPDSKQGPFPCNGFFDISKRWPRDSLCLPGYATYGVDDVSRGTPAKNVNFPDCCRLPHADILSDQHVYVSDVCPNYYISTGTGRDGLMRCTKINTKRYQLGKAKAAHYWGLGASRWGEHANLSKSDIPIAIRHGFGRRNSSLWDEDGCLGDPFGSLLTSSENPVGCKGIYFKELQYKGLTGDPKAGTPVKMFPDCEAIDNLFSKYPKCLY